MEFESITQIAIYLVFVLALIAFSLYPAIWLSEKLSLKFAFFEKHSTKLTIVFAVLFSLLGTVFIFAN